VLDMHNENVREELGKNTRRYGILPKPVVSFVDSCNICAESLIEGLIIRH
jgi:hypothetical protein